MPSPLPTDQVDDLTARVGRLEVIAADTRADVAYIKATLPHPSTKAELEALRADLKADIGELRAELTAGIGELRAELKADIGELRGELKSEIGRVGTGLERVDGNIARVEAAMIRWAVGSTLAGISAAFTIAKLVH